jgi:hypothetical protein
MRGHWGKQIEDCMYVAMEKMKIGKDETITICARLFGGGEPAGVTSESRPSRWYPDIPTLLEWHSVQCRDVGKGRIQAVS